MGRTKKWDIVSTYCLDERGRYKTSLQEQLTSLCPINYILVHFVTLCVDMRYFFYYHLS
jgi:hypothetical protein